MFKRQTLFVTLESIKNQFDISTFLLAFFLHVIVYILFIYSCRLYHHGEHYYLALSNLNHGYFSMQKPRLKRLNTNLVTIPSHKATVKITGLTSYCYNG